MFGKAASPKQGASKPLEKRAIEDTCLCCCIDVPCDCAKEGVLHLLRRDALPRAQALAWLETSVTAMIKRVGCRLWYARCWAGKQVLGEKS